MEVKPNYQLTINFLETIPKSESISIKKSIEKSPNIGLLKLQLIESHINSQIKDLSSTMFSPYLHKFDFKTQPQKKRQFLKLLLLILSLLINLSDTITDIIFTSQIYQESQKSDHQNNQFFILFIIMLLSLTYERYQSYYLCKDVLTLKNLQNLTNNKQNNNQEDIDSIIETQEIYTLNTKDYMIIFIHLATYTEPYLLWTIKDQEKKIRKILFQKRLYDFCSENLFFFIIGLGILLFKLINKQNIPFFIIISTILSFQSCLFVLYSVYIRRIKSAHKYRKKKFKTFKYFSLNLKLHLTQPYFAPLLKFTKNYRKEYIKQIKYSKYERNQSGILLNTPQKLNKFMKLYIFVFIFTNILLDISLYSMQLLNKSRLSHIQNLIIAGFLHSPMIIHHIYLILSNTKKLDQAFRKLLHFILLLPVSIIVGYAIFFFPLLSQEVPFIKDTKQVWKYNYYPTFYKLFAIFLYRGYNLFLIYEVIRLNQNYNFEYIQTKEALNYITDPESSFRILYYLLVFLYLLSIFFQVLYYIDQLYVKQPIQTSQISQYDKETQKYYLNNNINNNCQISNVDIIVQEPSNNHKDQHSHSLQENKNNTLIQTQENQTENPLYKSDFSDLEDLDQIYNNEQKQQIKLSLYSTNQLDQIEIKNEKTINQQNNQIIHNIKTSNFTFLHKLK